MDDINLLSVEQFTQRLVELCLRSNLSAIPKKTIDQQILLKSAAMVIGNSGIMTEKELTEKLSVWTNEVCVIAGFDRVSLRRWLVDSGYLIRSKDGAEYLLAQPDPGCRYFSPEINHLDIKLVLQDAREEQARRKQEFINKSH